MAPRKTPNHLSPQDNALSSSSSVPPSPSFPRSTSPSGGLSQFFSKPGKWFNRKASSSSVNTTTVDGPRSSSSSSVLSGGRKPKISHPTDPRPILESKFQSDSKISSSASRSVLDLSSKGSLDISHSFPSPTSDSPTRSGGLGDLRSISQKAWSRSADDLGKLSSPLSSPLNGSFQNKISQYRNRSNSNATPPSTINSNLPLGSGNMRHQTQPFPTIVTTSPLSSSPPQDNTIKSPVSINVSSPADIEAAIDKPFPTLHGSSSGAHNRSHSFTPKMPSKLSSQKLGFGPSSPKRKGSAPSEKEVELDREKLGLDTRVTTAGGAPSPTAARAIGVPPTVDERHIGRLTTLLSPQLGGLDDQDLGGPNSRRTSQIIYHAGFINRLAQLPASHHPYHTPHLSLAKGWKPFKMELKGSKLFFYKPPGDRSAAIRDLFPTDLVPALEEEEEPEISDSPTNSKRSEGAPARKKRAYWGRCTHPDLVVSEDKSIERGTFEALVHETVFATTLLETPAEGVASSSGEVEAQKARWKDFASAVLLCLPSLVGAVKFQSEFTRCCGHLISSAQPEYLEDSRARVMWLAEEYIRFHGSSPEPEEWERWRVETIPDFSANSSRSNGPSVVLSSSTQAIYNRTPKQDGQWESPMLGTFSPRPVTNDRMASLMVALAGPDIQVPVSPSRRTSSLPAARQRSGSVNARLWTALEREGLSREVLLSLDPYLIAQSLGLFHRTALQNIPENLTAEYLLGPEAPSPPDSAAPGFPSALFGSDKSPHWLTKVLLMQILGVDTSTGSLTSPQMLSAGRTSEDRTTQTTSRTHSRSEVISVWARIGELCRISGDECSWRAIAAALCSRPVSRLDKAWKRVYADAMSIVDSWVYPGADGEYASIRNPKLTPWGGDAKDRVKEILERSRSGHGDGWLIEPLKTVRELFEETRTSFSLCSRRIPQDKSQDDDINRMVGFWGELYAGNVRTGTLGSKFVQIEQFMSLSLAAEPRRKGLFEPIYWSQSRSGHPTHPLLPLLFPQPLPVVCLVNREEILRGRLDSGVSNVNLSELQFLRNLEPRSADRHSDAGDFSVGTKLLGSVIAVYDGELLLSIQRGSIESNPTSPSASRPSSFIPSRPLSMNEEPGNAEQRVSRTPSIRVKTGPIERKPSVARRSSLPSISRRPAFVSQDSSPETPLRAAVHGGTVDRLVDLLVHGLQGVSVAIADDNGEMPLRESKTRDLVVNHNDFARIWWNVFRSFVTPLVFFELMQKRYIGPRSPRQSLSVQDCLDLIHKRSQVIDVMGEWIFQGGGAQDVLDDVQLFNTVSSFLRTPSNHLLQGSALDDPKVHQAWDVLQQRRNSFASSFNSQTMRPTNRDASNVKLPIGNPKARNLGKEPPDIDRISPEQLVENLDAMAAATFSNVSEEDLFVTADLLEVQSADRAAWLLPKEPSSNVDDIEIQTMYSIISEVAPSSMISELSHDAIYRLLPPGIRSCIRAYGILRRWLISKIVAFQIGIRARQARMETLLLAIEIARLHSNADSGTSTFGSSERPCIRSFVEAVLTSAVLSAESRAHFRAWQNIATKRGTQCDSLASLLRKPTRQFAGSMESLTIDMSWVLERILEIVSVSDLLTPVSEDGVVVVNFDKRRHMCNLITNASNITPNGKIKSRFEIDRRDFERLNNIEREVNILQFDIRGIKEEAHREGTSATVGGSSSGKKAVRPFQKVVLLQQEKNKRDKHIRDRISKEKRQEQQKNEKREEQKHIQHRPSTSISAQRAHRNKKSMSSAFFQFMRPLSSAFTSEHDPTLVKKTPAELDFILSGKPILVLNVADAKVAQFINNERSFTFQLDTEDGGHYLLQAINRREMVKWLETINRVAKTTAKRRLTYTGTVKPQVSDHIHNPTTASRDPKAVFGVELRFLLQREAANGKVLPGAIPFVLERCLYEVELRGLTEVGIYRIAGATSEITVLKDAFNRGESPIEPSTDINAVCDLIKTWFRVLPEPLFPPSTYYDIIETMKITDFEIRLSKVRSVVRSLPQPNFDLLKRVSEHLDKVTDFEEQNHMTAEGLAIVFSPNLLRAPQNDFAMILANMGHTQKLVKSLITHFHVIFDDIDQEAEQDHEEDEFDEPILEEDEEEESMAHSSSDT